MSWKLYEIDDVLRQAIAAAEQAVDTETGELPEDWAEFLTTVQMERDEKALGVACYVRELLAEADAVKAEKDRLTKRQRALENQAERVKAYLAAFVPQGEKLKDGRVQVSWRKSESVQVDVPAEQLPTMYQRVIPEQREPDKTALKDAIKTGAQIPGVQLVTKQNIQIR